MAYGTPVRRESVRGSRNLWDGSAIRLFVGVFGPLRKLWGVLGEDMFEFLICREVALQLLGEFLGGDLVVGYAYGGG